VEQLDPEDGRVVAVHASLSDVCKRFRTSHARINQASASGEVYLGHRWRVIADGAGTPS
jgi:hypothetical protein